MAVDPEGRDALTEWTLVENLKNAALLDVHILTGRTHQIRAQFADKGHPLLGDGQYGDYRENERFGRDFQALYAYKLVFTFKSDAGVLNYLRDKIFEVWDVPFVEQYFPWEE